MNKSIDKINLKYVLIPISIVLLFPWYLVLDGDIFISDSLLKPSLKYPFGKDIMGRNLLFLLSKAVLNLIKLWAVGLFASIFSIFSSIFIINYFEYNRHLNFIFKIIKSIIIFIYHIPAIILIFFMSLILKEIGFISITIAIFIYAFIALFVYTQHNYESDKNLGYWLYHKILGIKTWKIIYLNGIKTKWKKSLITKIYSVLTFILILEPSASYMGFGVMEPDISFGNILKSHFSLFANGNGMHIILGASLYYLLIFLMLNLILKFIIEKI